MIPLNNIYLRTLQLAVIDYLSEITITYNNNKIVTIPFVIAGSNIFTQHGTKIYPNVKKARKGRLLVVSDGTIVYHVKQAKQFTKKNIFLMMN